MEAVRTWETSVNLHRTTPHSSDKKRLPLFHLTLLFMFLTRSVTAPMLIDGYALVGLLWLSTLRCVTFTHCSNLVTPLNNNFWKQTGSPLWSSGQSSWLLNGDVLCFLWGTDSIYVCYVEESRPPLWSSGQSFWLQIRRPGFDSRHYQKKM
jgi:hypothetical protein